LKFISELSQIVFEESINVHIVSNINPMATSGALESFTFTWRLNFNIEFNLSEGAELVTTEISDSQDVPHEICVFGAWNILDSGGPEH